MTFDASSGEFRALNKSETVLANDLANKIKLTFSHWDDDYPTLDIFEEDAENGELYGYFVDNKLVSIISATFSEEEFEDVIDVPGTNWPSCEKPCMLCRLCVDPDYRQMGIARMMMLLVEEEAKKRGADSLWLLVATDNPTALSIYLAAGYEIRGRANIYDSEFFSCVKGV